MSIGAIGIGFGWMVLLYQAFKYNNFYI